MCGIVGLLSSEKISPSVLDAMTTCIAHRGPDAQGNYFSPSQTIGLGHRRLSIIDLSETANQPMLSSSGRYVIVFNGEIYNYQLVRTKLEKNQGVVFRTHSDTEVAMEAFAAWGVSMVKELEGMFAMVIADVRDERLYLFRDRLGKKPLYYYEDDGLFAFASEIKALRAHPYIAQKKSIDWNAVTSFLHLGYVASPDTIYSSIRKFPAGHFGVVAKDSRLSTKSYWDVTSFAGGPRVSDAAGAISSLQSLLEESVRERLISDVPVGAFLSGGTDSALVCAVASRQLSQPLRTFSIGFSESRFDESRYARAVSKVLQTDHTEYTLSERDAVDKVELYLKHFDEPFADTSAIPTLLVSGLARQQVKVVLTGDGGDELFHGYGAYRWADRLARTRWKVIRKPVELVLRSSGRSRLERVSRLLRAPQRGDIRSHIFSQEQYYFSQDEIADEVLVDSSHFKEFRYKDPVAGRTPAEDQSLFDLMYYLPDDLLVKVDRASMYYALECRCPLLDHRIVEFALSLDPSLKQRDGVMKWIEKALLRTLLPDELVDRPKWGFSIPLGKWLHGDLHYLMDDYLKDSVVEETGICRPAMVNQLKNAFQNGKEYLYHRLWVLIVLHKWMRDTK